MSVRNRLALSLGLLALAVSASGCGSRGVERLTLVREAAPPIELGVFPFLQRQALFEVLQPLLAYLSEGLDRPVRLRVVHSYGELERLVSLGRIDVGWFTPRTRAGRSPATELQVLCHPSVDGGRPYHGLVVALRSGGIARLEDLRGKSFAYVDRHSNSGFTYPNRLLAGHGLDPLRDFASVEFAGSHDRALDGVLKGRWDAAAVTSLLFRDERRAALLRTDLAVLGQTAPISTDPIVARVALGPETLSKLTELLLIMGSDRAGKKALKALRRHLGIEAFVAEAPGREGSGKPASPPTTITITTSSTTTTTRATPRPGERRAAGDGLRSPSTSSGRTEGSTDASSIPGTQENPAGTNGSPRPSDPPPPRAR